MVEYLLDGKTLQSNQDQMVGHSDPVFLTNRCTAQKIKGTLGITGLPLFRVPIDGVIWHLDVGLSHPGAESGSKGLAVRQLKRYMSWV
jgi:hypothetical protein